MDEERDPSAGEDESEVVDRRTGSSAGHGRAAGDEVEPPPPASEPDEEEEAPEGPEGIPPEVLDLMIPRTVDLAARQAIAQFARLAWEHLGLVPGARTGKTEVSLSEAGRAIDAVGFLVKLVAPHLSPEHRRDLETLADDLKVNYVHKQRG